MFPINDMARIVTGFRARNKKSAAAVQQAGRADIQSVRLSLGAVKKSDRLLAIQLHAEQSRHQNQAAG
jgi:hypothetical protein